MPFQPIPTKQLSLNRFSTVVELGDGKTTALHVVRYARDSFRPRLVAFGGPTLLRDWCEENGVAEALVGGFFLRESGEVLGELWLQGERQSSVPVMAPWSNVRGSLYLSGNQIQLGPRSRFPARPAGSLIQAGPMLVERGVAVDISADAEGVSKGSKQFDSDITQGRHPRAAIGLNDDYIWSVVCDGRSEADAGMTLAELAAVFIKLGAKEALNLDGGGSATQISGGQMRNHSRGDGQEYKRGRPVYSAIVFN